MDDRAVSRYGPNQTLVGMGFVVLAYFLFSFHDAAIKWLVTGLSVWQVMVVRSATIVALSLAIGRGPLIAEAARSRAKRDYLILAVILVTAWQLYYAASRTLQLGELTTFYFTTPIIAIILAQPMLGDRAGLVAWVAAGIGFAGVVVASRPGSVGLDGAVLMVVVASALWALAQVLMRRLGRSERSERALIQMLYTNSGALLASAVVAPFVWRAGPAADWLLLGSLGFLGGAAQFALIEGFRRASPGALAPFQYSALIWAVVLGYLIWNDVPDRAVMAGAALIIVAGAMVIADERRRRRQAR
ncbi:MAG: DMT family transporter [Alphaproteobacteria bacterium]|nr:DMT family transporter [Alphaproteobacteria bacterium]